MRLLNVNTLKFKDFFALDIPPYGILSHRWSEDEVSHKDCRKGHERETSGYRKIQKFCAFIRERTMFNFEPTVKQYSNVIEAGKGSSRITPYHEGEALQWVWIDSI